VATGKTGVYSVVGPDDSLGYVSRGEGAEAVKRLVAILAVLGLIVGTGCLHTPVAMRYSLTEAQVQTVRDELLVVALPVDPERLVPEYALGPGGLRLPEGRLGEVDGMVFDCFDKRTGEGYTLSVNRYPLNDRWVLELDQEDRRSGLRVSGVVIPMS
jgi:hypothetical protein